MTELEILDKVVGGMTIRDMPAMTFFQWIAKRLNDLPSYSAATVELTSLVTRPPMTRNYPDSEKIKLIRKMMSLNIEIK
jgi:hypothetical protein